MNDPAFNPGFRFSTLDAVVLIIGSAAAMGLAVVDFWIGVAIAFVILHFFLFCNVLRTSRPLELLWAATFAGLAVLATASLVTWPLAIGASLVSTVIVTIVELRRPSYHGVAWKRVNPQLPSWWRTRTAGGEPAAAVDE